MPKLNKLELVTLDHTILDRKDFPILADLKTNTSFPNHKLVYLDSAATSLKPNVMLAAVYAYDTSYTANLHRGLYQQAELVTSKYEHVRTQVADFIGAQTSEIVFTAGATAGINFVATSWGESNLQPGDELIVTELEHHANFLPWLELAKRKQFILKIVSIDPVTGELDLENFKKLLTAKTKLIAVSLSSNVLGVPTSAPELIKLAKSYNPEIKILVDAAQIISHARVNTQELNCDFLVFSGHKIFAPTGVGVLFIRAEIGEQLEPYQYGGGMVFDLNYSSASWLKAPYKFEAGTPPIAQVLGLGAALEYLQAVLNVDVTHSIAPFDKLRVPSQSFDFSKLQAHLANLCTVLINNLAEVPGIKILGDLDKIKTSGHIVSFSSDKYHAHDIAAYLDRFGICVRAGNHCAKLLHLRLGVESSVRVSLHGYNNLREIDYLVESLRQLF
jgi:cysteine desulfurase/selenocysteine lyase